MEQKTEKGRVTIPTDIDVISETKNLIEKWGADGKSCYVDPDGEYFRCFLFIEHTICLQKIEKLEQFYQSGKSFGRFMQQLGDYPADSLYDTIPRFHDTPLRFQNFLKAVEEDSVHRVSLVAEEIAFITERVSDMDYLESRKKEGILPIRVTHNDTKLNNILLDEDTEEGLCIIDLDILQEI